MGGCEQVAKAAEVSLLASVVPKRTQNHSRGGHERSQSDVTPDANSVVQRRHA